MTPLVPTTVYGVVLLEPDGKEWLDYGTLRATEDGARLAGTDWYRSSSAAWRRDNKPTFIRRFTLTAANEANHEDQPDRVP